MANITFKGNAIQTSGELPKPGSKAPSFTLTNGKLEDLGLEAWKGKKKILSINPSLDTGVCQATARNFNKRVGEIDNTVLLVITADLPFAQKRFCEAEGLDHVVPLSMMRDREFAKTYGVLMTQGPLRGLTARAVVVIDENDTVKHAELVPEVTQEPNYDAALQAAQR